MRCAHRSTKGEDARARRNRHGLVANAMVTNADGYADREAAKAMINDARQALDDSAREITLRADKGYDAQEFVQACVDMRVAPHVARNKSGRHSAVRQAIAQSEGYAVSQQKRKLIEQGHFYAKDFFGIAEVFGFASCVPNRAPTACRARDKRLMTVPIGTSSTSAASR